MMSIPSLRSFAARCVTARVRDGAILRTRSEILIAGSIMTEPRLEGRSDHLGHHSCDVASEARHLLYQRGADEEVVLVGHHEERLHVRSEAAVHVGELKLVLEVGERSQAAH